MLVDLFDEAKVSFCENIAHGVAEEETDTNPFFSNQMLYERAQIQIKNNLQLFFVHLQQGVDILREELQHFDLEKQAKFDAIFQELDPSKLTSPIAAAYPLKLSHDQLEDLYGLTKKLIDESKMVEASYLLIVLTLIAPDCFAFWLAMGFVEQELSHHQLALALLAQASLLNFDHPVPHFLSAECYLATGDIENAQYSLKLALSFNEQKSVLDTVVPRLKRLQTALSHVP